MLNLRKCPVRVLVFLITSFLLLQISAFAEAIGEEGGRMGDSPVYLRIKSAVDSIRLIDTHEHQVTEELRLSSRADLFFWIVQPWGFTQNTDSDLMAAGLTEEDRVFISDPKNDDRQRWARLAPYWEATKYTSYALPVRIAARDIHGVEDIGESTWSELNRKIIAANKPGIRREILHERAGIEKRDRRRAR